MLKYILNENSIEISAEALYNKVFSRWSKKVPWKEQNEYVRKGFREEVKVVIDSLNWEIPEKKVKLGLTIRSFDDKLRSLVKNTNERVKNAAQHERII